MSFFFRLDSRPDTLREGCRLAGYSAEESALLLAGGLRAIPIGALVSEEFRAILNASLFGRLNRSSDVRAVQRLADRAFEHVICDAYYQHLYPAWPLEPLAVYGRRGSILAAPEVDLPGHRELRVRHRSVPTYVASTYAELEMIRDGLRAAAPPGQHVLFRGQTRQYLLSRPPEVKEFLFGSDGVDAAEPSLLTTAHRAGADGDRLLAELYFELSDLAYADADLRAYAEKAVVGLSPLLAVPQLASEIAEPKASGGWRKARSGALYAEMLALAQHYGIPTYGLDLTGELAVATWFATHASTTTPRGTYRFDRVTKWGPTPDVWPCVYFLLVDEANYGHFGIGDLLKTTAMRPQRQHAFLAFGGWGWNANSAAELLRVAVYLSPEFADPDAVPNCPALFPRCDEDPFYDFLLRRKARASPSAEYLYDHLPVLDE